MGLRKPDSLLPVAVVSALIVVLGLFGDAATQVLAWSRDAVGDGEWWRLVSGHFVHLTRPHLALNLAGLWLVWFLVADTQTPLRWLLITVVLIVGIDLGFWLLEPQLVWYVGLSGVLHGWLAAGIVAELPQRRADTWILAVIVIAKIAYEQLHGPMPGSESTTGGAVIVAAHLYGALSGAVIAALMLIRVRAKASI